MNMYKTWLILSVLFITACSQAPKTDAPPVDNISQAMTAAERSDADRARDARSRPDVTLAMLDIGPGDVVFDVFGGGGYYSELIARVVGEDGKVYLHNNQAYRNFVNEGLTERMKQNQMPQMIQYDREVDDLDLTPNSLDAAMIIMSYHDLFYDDRGNGWPQIDHQDFMQQIYTGLKTGGRFMIVDHQANAGRQAFDSQSLHRIEKDYAIERIEAIGFKLVAESAVLANPNDDKSTSVFTPEIRGKTDRFIVVFEKQ
jgi:predicted methyltransferase